MTFAPRFHQKALSFSWPTIVAKKLTPRYDAIVDFIH
jgi:hypothetical protein